MFVCADVAGDVLRSLSVPIGVFHYEVAPHVWQVDACASGDIKDVLSSLLECPTADAAAVCPMPQL